MWRRAAAEVIERRQIWTIEFVRRGEIWQIAGMTAD